MGPDDLGHLFKGTIVDLHKCKQMQFGFRTDKMYLIHTCSVYMEEAGMELEI